MSNRIPLAKRSLTLGASALVALAGPNLTAHAHTPSTASHAAAARTFTAPERGAGSDLSIVGVTVDKSHDGVLLSVLIANLGDVATKAQFQVMVVLPNGASTPGPTFPTGCTTSAQGEITQCPFPPGLDSLRTATVLMPVTLRPHTPQQRGTVFLISPERDQNGTRSAEFTLPGD